jgi:hypothetical protein
MADSICMNTSALTFAANSAVENVFRRAAMVGFIVAPAEFRLKP